MLPDSAIRHYRTKLIYIFLIETVVQPYGMAVDSLIAEFSKQNNISYLYDTHDVQSGLVTHKNEKTMIQ